MPGPGRAGGGHPETPRHDARGKRGLHGQPDNDTLTALADRVAEIAAAEARALVHTAAGLAGKGQAGVLEAIERAAQRSAAGIGLAAMTGVINWASQHATGQAQCPHSDAHQVRLVAQRSKTVRTLLGTLEISRGYALDLPTNAPSLIADTTRETRYFTNNHHRMQYADFKANGYYIGSGHVEAACNTIVKQRAKRAGMHWTITGLDPILALRTLHQSRRDHTLWPNTNPTPQT